MEIKCECGSFRAELKGFPRNTPGRLKCYCDDCQSFLHYLKRADLLDANGGSEIIPVYPSDFRFLAGVERLKCVRLKPKGMYRFVAGCCNTPVANTDKERPWVGVHRRMFPTGLEGLLSRVRASIHGKYAHGTLPPGVPQSFDLKGFAVVMPFLLKGMMLGRKRPSPFFVNEEPLVEVHVLSKDERGAALVVARAAPAAGQ